MMETTPLLLGGKGGGGGFKADHTVECSRAVPLNLAVGSSLFFAVSARNRIVTPRCAYQLTHTDLFTQEYKASRSATAILADRVLVCVDGAMLETVQSTSLSRNRIRDTQVVKGYLLSLS
jgi:hypothetical protein